MARDDGPGSFWWGSNCGVKKASRASARDASRRQRAHSFWTGTRGVKKAGLVSRHLSSSFVAQYYEVVHTLGHGSFGHVDLVCERATGQYRVCKVVSTAGMNQQVLEMMRKEVQVLCALDFPHIVKLYEFAEDPIRQELVLILEYVPGGNCLELLNRKDRVLREKVVAKLIYQLLVALDYCHANGIAHRDVKPENMLLTEATGSPDCKVIDFGFATPYRRAVRELAGTAPYLAPEVVIQQSGYTPKADVWSVGVTAFELLAGTAPFGRQEDYGGDSKPVLDRIRKYRRFDDLVGIFEASPGYSNRRRSAEAADFLGWLLNPDPGSRPTAAEAVEHPWLAQHRATHSGLTAEMIQSLASYAAAPAVARSCAFAIAAKDPDVENVETVGAAFLDADGDGDGKVSRQDLTEAVDQARGWWGPRLDVDAFFRAADPGGTGFVGYTEFAAACLYGSFGPWSVDLAARAFDVLDHDRDGLLHSDDVAPLFRELPQGLPRHRPFDLDEWCNCLLGRSTEHPPSGGWLLGLGRVFGGCGAGLRDDRGMGGDDDAELVFETQSESESSERSYPSCLASPGRGPPTPRESVDATRRRPPPSSPGREPAPAVVGPDATPSAAAVAAVAAAAVAVAATVQRDAARHPFPAFAALS